MDKADDPGAEALQKRTCLQLRGRYSERGGDGAFGWLSQAVERMEGRPWLMHCPVKVQIIVFRKPVCHAGLIRCSVSSKVELVRVSSKVGWL